jgi:DHA2 family multidrug resistance protein-like MFS transporter
LHQLGVRHRHADGARDPESRAEAKRDYRFDTIGILTFMSAMFALQIFATQGAKLGWLSLASLGLLAVAVVFGAIFFRTDLSRRSASTTVGVVDS